MMFRPEKLAPLVSLTFCCVPLQLVRTSGHLFICNSFFLSNLSNLADYDPLNHNYGSVATAGYRNDQQYSYYGKHGAISRGMELAWFC